jgi:glycosyltransferase involved in cell wall biosynthesis
MVAYMTLKLSVVMPVWNTKPEALKRSMKSMLAQKFDDRWEFIIVADEPSEETNKNILSSIKFNHDTGINIIYIDNSVRQGLSRSLNQGFAIAKGKYIARMDADDFSFPNRLQTQYDFMETHPEIGISGSAHWMHRHGETYITYYPKNIGEIHSRLMFGPCLAHPTTIFRSDFIKTIYGPYDPNYIHAEDYELWVRCADKTFYGNIDDVLVYIENDGDNVSDRFLAIQEESAKRIRNVAAKKFGFPEPYEDHGKWITDIYTINESKNIFPKEFFNHDIANHWYRYCQNFRAREGISAWFLFWNHPLSKYSDLTLKQKIKFLGACMIKWNMEDRMKKQLKPN